MLGHVLYAASASVATHKQKASVRTFTQLVSDSCNLEQVEVQLNVGRVSEHLNFEAVV